MDREVWESSDCDFAGIRGGAADTMRALSGRHVFLSASFPSGNRGDEVRPFDASAIADAVSAIVREVLLSDGKLLFGGHPTITPLVLMIGTELQVHNAVDIFQSKWFCDRITQETVSLAKSGVGTIHWTPRLESLSESLAAMRERMLRFVRPAGAVFVGGMSGILQEYELFGTLCPGVPRIPISGPGGAAAQLPSESENVPETLRTFCRSRHYPFVASMIVETLVDSSSRLTES